MKGLDQQSAAHAQQTQRPHKDVNTFINNQLKFPPSQPATNPIPPDQMKCNILKAKAEQQHKYVNGKGLYTLNEQKHKYVNGKGPYTLNEHKHKYVNGKGPCTLNECKSEFFL